MILTSLRQVRKAVATTGYECYVELHIVAASDLSKPKDFVGVKKLAILPQNLPLFSLLGNFPSFCADAQ